MVKLLLPALLTYAGFATADCTDITFQNNKFTICKATAKDDLRLWHSDAEGAVFGSFENVAKSLAPAETLQFALNAGMYHPDRRPVGLYVEAYVQKAPLVVGASYGNFGLVPNGVFCIEKDRLRVQETLAFKAAKPKCRFASQSGPMLVIDGKLHPKLLASGTSKRLRNGVGVTPQGDLAVFAISRQPVNFHSFASLFREYLKLPNALYFDGTISRLYAPMLRPARGGLPMGPIVGVVTRNE